MDLHVVGGKLTVSAQDGETFHPGLGDQQSVEGVESAHYTVPGSAARGIVGKGH